MRVVGVLAKPLVKVASRGARLRYAFPVIALLVVITMGVNEHAYWHAQNSFAAAVRMSDARTTVRTMAQSLRDVEWAQRGLVLKPSPRTEAQYQQARMALDGMMPRLQTALALMVSDHTAVLDQIRTILSKRLAELDRSIQLSAEGRRDEALALAVADTDDDVATHLQGLLDARLKTAFERQLELRTEMTWSLQSSRWGIHALLLAGLITLFVLVQQLRLHERKQTQLREALDQERNRLASEVERQTADLRALATYLQTAQEDERSRLARELHDELGAILTSAKMDLARARSKVPEDLKPVFARLTERINQGVALKRRIVEDLRPSSLTHLGLEAAIALLCSDMSASMGIPIERHIEIPPVEAPADLTAFRVIQEALTNAAKYAHASRIDVEAVADGDMLALKVTDNGQGFDAALARVGAHGLAGMRFRVEALGGAFDINSVPGQGSTILARVPYQPKATPSQFEHS